MAKKKSEKTGKRTTWVFTPIYQFKITLLGSQPPIWRRIQIQDCMLDKLHEHIQTAMGWTNSHLHHFEINKKRYGDPDLLADSGGEFEDSTTTRLSELLPKSGKSFQFVYTYDFGDYWQHDVFFEGVVQAVKGAKLPICLDGEQACPPEDCGGLPGYEHLLAVLDDSTHEEHREMKRWVGGRFDPESFDATAATKAMKKGLPDWRSDDDDDF